MTDGLSFDAVFRRRSSAGPHGGPPGEADVQDHNPEHVTRLRALMGWERLERGSVNLYVNTADADRLAALTPVYDEDALTLLYPEKYLEIRKLRERYWYYRATVRRGEFVARVLIRRAKHLEGQTSDPSEAVIEAFADIALTERLQLKDNDTVSVEVATAPPAAGSTLKAGSTSMDSGAPPTRPYDGRFAPGPQYSFEQVFKLWSKYEDVAMHFNELILRLRFQALAGVAGLATLIGVFGRAVEDTTLRSALLSGVFTLLAAFWVAIWVLDRSYYDKLLRGAVDSLLKLEQFTTENQAYLSIDLSTRIDRLFQRDAPWWKDGRNWFYVIVFVGLLLGVVLHLRPVIAWAMSLRSQP